MSAAKKIETAARFISFRYLNCSYYGNPRAEIVAEIAGGDVITARTATYSDAAYCVSNWRGAARRGFEFCDITYHKTRGGSLIVDYISENYQDKSGRAYK